MRIQNVKRLFEPERPPFPVGAPQELGTARLVSFLLATGGKQDGVDTSPPNGKNAAMAGEPGTDEIGRLLAAAEAGEDVDMGALLPLVYGQLRRIAQQQMNSERRNHTLQATALVHEAYLRIIQGGGRSWKSKSHFYRAAAQSMRRILVDHARGANREKRGGDRKREAISLADLVTNRPPEEFLAVDEAMCRFKEAEPRAGSVAELRLFAGLSLAETAEALGMPLRTVERDWSYARTWLHEALR